MENRLSKMLEMVENHPEDSFLNYAIGLEYLKNGEPQNAFHYLGFVRYNDPEYLAVYYQLGKLHEELGNAQEAIQVYDEGINVAERQKNQKTLEELMEAKSIAEQ